MTFEEFLAARLESLLRYASVLTCDPHLAQHGGERHVPLTVGWFPNGLRPDGVSVSATGRPGMAQTSAGPVIVTVGRRVDRHVPSGGRPVTVDAHPARWITIPQGGKPLTYLIVTLRPDRFLTVEVNNGFNDGRVIDQKDSIRVAQSVSLEENWDW